MPSIFSEEWRDCLRAHYSYVVRMGDQGTEKTLRGVMFEAGFGEDEVKQLYMQATAHVDDVGVDFVPNMEIFEEDTAMSIAVAMPEAAEPPEVEAEPELDAADLELEDAEADIAEMDDERPPEDDPGIAQLSLF